MSGNFKRSLMSFAGYIGIFLANFIVGSAIFCLCLWFDSICPVTYFKILVTVLGGAFLPIAVSLICSKLCDLKRLGIFIFTLTGILCAFYFKWAVYDVADIHSVYEQMKSQTAYTYYGFDEIFPENTDFETVYKAYNNIESENGGTLWESMDFDILLGETAEQAEISLENSRSCDAYTFTFENGKLEKITFWDILSDPQGLWRDICSINSEGRWKFSQSSHYNVRGTFLWLIWIGEFFVLCLPGVAHTILKKYTREDKAQ